MNTISFSRDVVRDKAHGLSQEVSLQIKCPFCVSDWVQQGNPTEWKPNKSMSITKEGDTILYHCFRAGCKNGRGAIHLLDFTKRPLLKEDKFQPRWYKYRTILAPPYSIPSKITLTRDQIKEQHIRYAPDRDTVVYPIFDVYHHEVGVVDRAYHVRDPKAMTYWFSDVPKCHFPIHEHQGDTVVLVEDIPSSIKVSSYMPAVALLGTSITPEVLHHLRRLYTNVVIALDEDATSKAIHLAKKYTLFFRNIQLLVLSNDIKNMQEKDIQILLQEYL